MLASWMIIVYAFLPATASKCTSDMDCSLAGKCDAATGKCACEGWTKGEDCAALNLVPLSSKSAFKSVISNTSEAKWTTWGGSVVEYQGKHHMFAAEMADHCTLGVWTFKSQVIHAIADNPLGPFKRAGVAIPTEAHNPVLSRDTNDGTWLIWTCGCPHDWTPSPGNCTRQPLTCPGGAPAPWTTTVYSSKSLDGPWVPHVDLLGNITRGRLGSQNVSPIMHADGSVHLMFKGPDNNTEASVAYASHWKGPYTLQAVNVFAEFFKDNITNEDVWWWQSGDGHYHALSHRMTPSNREDSFVGGHAFSKHIAHGWVEALTPAYTKTLALSGGGSMRITRRERPQLLRDAITGAPLVLFNGVSGGKDELPFTFAQRLGPF